MARSYVLVQTDTGRATEIAVAAAQLPGVLMADTVTGPYDVVIELDDADSQALPSVQTMPGVTRTVACVPSALLV